MSEALAATPLSYDLRPRLREDIVFGPPELRGDRTVFYLKDKATDWYFRIGLAEHFILSRMDGARSLAEIGEEFREAAGRPLSGQSWQQIFDLVEKRQMLADSADPAKLEELRLKAEEKRDSRRLTESFFQRRFSIADPDRFLEKILPALRWAFSPFFVIPALVAIYGMEILVFRHFPELLAAVVDLRSRHTIWPIIIVMFWGFSIFHELAHGLAVKRFGGSVRDMGVVWRYMWFFPYTKLDDIVTFHNRWHRFHCAFAGIFMSMMIFLGAGIVWFWGPQDASYRGLVAIVLTVYNISIFRNFIPFMKLDGYFMLSHALRMADLREESYSFWKKLFRKLWKGEGDGVGSYYTRSKIIYLWYGLLSFLFTIAFMTTMAYFWFNIVNDRAGPLVAALVLAIPFGRSVYVRLKRRRAKQEAEAEAAAREAGAEPVVGESVAAEAGGAGELSQPVRELAPAADASLRGSPGMKESVGQHG